MNVEPNDSLEIHLTQWDSFSSLKNSVGIRKNVVIKVMKLLSWLSRNILQCEIVKNIINKTFKVIITFLKFI